MKLFLKSIIVGLGGVMPGLSGSVLMILFGLYEDVLNALGTIFVDFGKKIKYLSKIVAGMVVGVLLFSKVMDFFLTNFEVPTRYAFLGMILGTVPFFYKEVKKKGFNRWYYVLIAASFLLGTFLFTVDRGGFKQIVNPTFLQKLELGVGVAASAIIPGVDPAVLLSSLGLYEIYVEALADLRFDILLPMVLGLAGGAIGISYLMSRILKRFYTISFSVIFGVFLSMIPNMLNERCILEFSRFAVVSILALVAGLAISYFFGKLEEKQSESEA